MILLPEEKILSYKGVLFDEDVLDEEEEKEEKEEEEKDDEDEEEIIYIKFSSILTI